MKVFTNQPKLYEYLLPTPADTFEKADICIWMLEGNVPIKTSMEMVVASRYSHIRSLWVVPKKYVEEVDKLSKGMFELYTDYMEAVSIVNSASLVVTDVVLSDFVRDSARNMNVPLTDEEVEYISTTLKSALKKYSILTCAVTLYDLFKKSEAKTAVVYRELLDYEAAVYRRLALAEEEFARSQSHYKSVVASQCGEPRGATDFMERATKSIILRPLAGTVNDILERPKEVLKLYIKE